MDFEAEIKKLWEQNSKLWAEKGRLETKVMSLEKQMEQLDEMILSNPGFQKKEEEKL